MGMAKEAAQAAQDAQDAQQRLEFGSCLRCGCPMDEFSSADFCTGCESHIAHQ